MLRRGAGNPWKDETIRTWTFATCPEDREWGVLNAAKSQVGAMKRTAHVTTQALAPPDEREEKHALGADSKGRIEKLSEEQDIELNAVLKSVRDVAQDLLDRETLKQLEAFGELDGN